MASITLTIPDTDVPRVLEAYGVALGLKDGGGAPIPATAAQVKQSLMTKVRAVVREYEQAKRLKTTIGALPPIEDVPVE